VTDAGRVIAWAEELRRVHGRLRESLELAYDGYSDLDTEKDLLLYCWGFCVALDGHHRSEDAALFPAIVAARPDLAPVIAALSQDHSMIDHLIAGLKTALEAGLSTEEKRRHLDGIGAVMETHFRFEEKKLIEVLEASRTLELELGDDTTRVLGSIAD
jgi:hypothetical protein